MSSPQNDQGHPVSLRRRFFSLPTLLSFAVAVGLIYFLATRFDLDWRQTWDNVRAMDPRLYIMAMVLYYSSFVFRGLRWRTLARNARPDDSPGAGLPHPFRFSQLILMGWFVNAVAWLRLGDAYRAYGLSEEMKVDFSWSLGTVLAERVVDMATVLVLIFVGVALFSATHDSSGTGYILGAAVVMSAVLLALLAMMKGVGARLARFLPRRLESAYGRFHHGTMGSLKQLPLIFALGLAAWLMEVGALYFVIQALSIEVGMPLVIIVSLGHSILSTVPTPGGVGAVEPGVTGLLMLSLVREDAVSIALVDRSITYLSVILFGGLAFLLWHAARARRRSGQALGARHASGRADAADS